MSTGKAAGSRGVTRRRFVALSGSGAMASAFAARQQAAVFEKDVTITTPDGVCDAVHCAPTKGRHPGVLIWPDAFGLRSVLRTMAKQLAGEGYSVLVPNPFYRVAKAPVFADASKFDFGNTADRAKLQSFTGPLNAPGAAERDAAAYVDFLDSLPQTDRKKKIGTQGYCMGGPLVMKTAAARPERIGAGASFHGGGLVTDQPGSPHLLVPKIKARMYIAVAANDDERQPDAKERLRAAFASANVMNEVEVYAGAAHGWCMADMPNQNGKPIYDAAGAQRAWEKLLALYKLTLRTVLPCCGAFSAVALLSQRWWLLCLF
jgi:carboxymethylenebutenolidase